MCILEAKTIASGVTSGSSAILTFAQELIYDTLIKKHGLEVAKTYLNDTKNTINEIVNIIKTENIECNLSRTNFVLFTTKASGISKLNKEIKAYQQLGVNVQEFKICELPMAKVLL